MSTGSGTSLEEKRDTLQRRMHAQRLLIDQQLTSWSATSGRRGSSVTMRLLSEHPTLTGRLLTGIAVVQLGARVLAARKDGGRAYGHGAHRRACPAQAKPDGRSESSRLFVILVSLAVVPALALAVPVLLTIMRGVKTSRHQSSLTKAALRGAGISTGARDTATR